jgi:AcrR family transcriptional regulator
LLDAGREVFLARGYERATLEQIADEAGFSKGVVYSQFDSKADLFFALLDRRIADRATENAAAVSRASGLDGVLSLLRVAERDIEAEPRWRQLVVEFRIHAARDPQLNRRYASAHARTRELITRQFEALYERAGTKPPVPPRDLAQAILVFEAGATLESFTDPGVRHFRLLATLLVRAFGEER